MPNKFAQLLVTMLLTALLASNSYAIGGVMLGAGPAGSADIMNVRLGLIKDWVRPLHVGNNWEIGGYWDLGLYAMHRSNDPDYGNSNNLLAISFAPMFLFEKTTPMLDDIWPYLELGVGVAQVSKRSIADRDLGTNFQFEDKLGFGFRFGDCQQYDLSYKVVHFSNLYIGNKNNGINLHVFALTHRF